MQAGGGEAGASALPRAIPLDEVELSHAAPASSVELAATSKAVILMPDGEQLAYATRIDSDVNLERPDGSESEGGDKEDGPGGAAAGAGAQRAAPGQQPGQQPGLMGRLRRALLQARQRPAR